MTELERLNNDKYFGALYDVEEEQKRMEASAKESGYKDGLQEGKEIGVQEGQNIEKREIAINLLKNNVDINIISKATGLSIKEIEELE